VRAVPRAMSTGHVPGPKKPKGATDDFLLDGVSSRYVPNYLTGQAVHPRTLLFSSLFLVRLAVSVDRTVAGVQDPSWGRAPQSFSDRLVQALQIRRSLHTCSMCV
jgi:hypothetical protein